MKTISLETLVTVTGGVNGKDGGCIPQPFPGPRNPFPGPRDPLPFPGPRNPFPGPRNPILGNAGDVNV
ncbi:MAG TPA: hypothetical protein VFQ53_08280 [Kofleriaceae bacterium]|nr:hypothetical protein [Kofleriaceae bacterium]